MKHKAKISPFRFPYLALGTRYEFSEHFLQSNNWITFCLFWFFYFVPHFQSVFSVLVTTIIVFRIRIFFFFPPNPVVLKAKITGLKCFGMRFRAFIAEEISFFFFLTILWLESQKKPQPSLNEIFIRIRIIWELHWGLRNWIIYWKIV